MIFPLKRLADLGFDIVATGGTADVLRRNGVKVGDIRKIHEPGEGMDTVDRIEKVRTTWKRGLQNVPEYAVKITGAAVLPAP